MYRVFRVTGSFGIPDTFDEDSGIKSSTGSTTLERDLDGAFFTDTFAAEVDLRAEVDLVVLRVAIRTQMSVAWVFSRCKSVIYGTTIACVRPKKFTIYNFQFTIKYKVKLINQTTKKVISNNLIIAKTLTERSIGLLNKPKGTTLFFKTRWGIHTFFMKYPINVLILDSNFRVKYIKKNLKSNRAFFWNPLYFNVIESSDDLPINTGDIVEIIKNPHRS